MIIIPILLLITVLLIVLIVIKKTPRTKDKIQPLIDDLTSLGFQKITTKPPDALHDLFYGSAKILDVVFFGQLQSQPIPIYSAIVLLFQRRRPVSTTTLIFWTEQPRSEHRSHSYPSDATATVLTSLPYRIASEKGIIYSNAQSLPAEILEKYRGWLAAKSRFVAIDMNQNGTFGVALDVRSDTIKTLFQDFMDFIK